MTTSCIFFLALPLLLLAATMGNNTEVDNQDNQVRNINETQACRQLQLQTPLQRYHRTKNWARFQRDMESMLDHDSKEYSQLHNIDFWAMYRIGHRNYTELASLLLCVGMPVDETDGDGDTMLHGAATGGRLQMASMLLNHGADVNARGIGDTTPLIRAAKNGHLEVVKLLVRAGANTTATDINGRTALYRATVHDMTDVVHYLAELPH